MFGNLKDKMAGWYGKIKDAGKDKPPQETPNKPGFNSDNSLIQANLDVSDYDMRNLNKFRMENSYENNSQDNVGRVVYYDNSYKKVISQNREFISKKSIPEQHPRLNSNCKRVF